MMDVTSDYFLIERSQLNTSKMFVEFYLPKYQALFAQLRQGKYPLVSLKQLSRRLFDGPFGSSRKVEMYQEEGIPYIRVKDVLPDGINTNDLAYISEEKHRELRRSRVVPGNLLVTIAGRVGTVAVFPDDLEEGNITGHIVGIELPETVNPYYLATFLNSPLGQFQFTILGHRTTRPELNLHEVGQVLVPIPPRSVQDSISKIMQAAYVSKNHRYEEAEQFFLGIEEYVLRVLGISEEYKKIKDATHFLIPESQLHRFEVRYFLPYYSQLEKLIEEGKFSTKPLRSVCTKLVSGLTPAKAGYTEDNFAVIKVASLTKLLQIDWQKIAFTSADFFEKAKKAHIKDGDLLLLAVSHQSDYIGRSFALVRDIPSAYLDVCMAVGELIIVRADPQILLPEYLLACLILQPVQKLVNRMTRGQSAHLYVMNSYNYVCSSAECGFG